MDTAPTLAGFEAFITNVMGISTAILPSSAPVISESLTMALAIANRALNAVPVIYTAAVYNLAADFLINYAPDQPGAPIYKDGSPFFEYLRKAWHIHDFVAGVLTSSGDEGTSAAYTTPEFMKTFTMADLQNLKTPYGRQYLASAQRYGTAWGMS